MSEPTNHTDLKTWQNAKSKIKHLPENLKSKKKKKNGQAGIGNQNLKKDQYGEGVFLSDGFFLTSFFFRL